MTDLFLHDPVVWLVISFTIFVVAAFIFGRKSATDVLDLEISKIRTQIAAAEKLKSEAEILVAHYQSNLKNAQIEADKIISGAKIQANDILVQSDAQLQESMERREAMLKNRIEQMERTAIDDIRRYAAELAVSATTQIITQTLNQQSIESLADKSIGNISGSLN